MGLYNLEFKQLMVKNWFLEKLSESEVETLMFGNIIKETEKAILLSTGPATHNEFATTKTLMMTPKSNDVWVPKSVLISEPEVVSEEDKLVAEVKKEEQAKREEERIAKSQVERQWKLDVVAALKEAGCYRGSIRDSKATLNRLLKEYNIKVK